MATNKVMKTVTTSGLDAHMRGPDKEEYIDTYMHIRHTTGGQTKDTHTHRREECETRSVSGWTHYSTTCRCVEWDTERWNVAFLMWCRPRSEWPSTLRIRWSVLCRYRVHMKMNNKKVLQPDRQSGTFFVYSQLAHIRCTRHILYCVRVWVISICFAFCANRDYCGTQRAIIKKKSKCHHTNQNEALIKYKTFQQ